MVVVPSVTHRTGFHRYAVDTSVAAAVNTLAAVGILAAGVILAMLLLPAWVLSVDTCSCSRHGTCRAGRTCMASETLAFSAVHFCHLDPVCLGRSQRWHLSLAWLMRSGVGTQVVDDLWSYTPSSSISALSCRHVTSRFSPGSYHFDPHCRRDFRLAVELLLLLRLPSSPTPSP